MKTLFLLRHAKTEHAAPGIEDFDRKLTPQGSADGLRVGAYLKQCEPTVEQIISSPAIRARETTELVKQAAGLDLEVQYDRRMYEADPQLMLDIVSEGDAALSCILLVGHNPAMEDFLRGLTGQLVSLSAGSLAQVESPETNWIDVKPGNCKLKFALSPAEMM